MVTIEEPMTENEFNGLFKTMKSNPNKQKELEEHEEMQEELDEAAKKRYDTLAAKYPPKESCSLGSNFPEESCSKKLMIQENLYGNFVILSISNCP